MTVSVQNINAGINLICTNHECWPQMEQFIAGPQARLLITLHELERSLDDSGLHVLAPVHTVQWLIVRLRLLEIAGAINRLRRDDRNTTRIVTFFNINHIYSRLAYTDESMARGMHFFRMSITPFQSAVASFWISCPCAS